MKAGEIFEKGKELQLGCFMTEGDYMSIETTENGTVSFELKEGELSADIILSKEQSVFMAKRILGLDTE